MLLGIVRMTAGCTMLQHLAVAKLARDREDLRFGQIRQTFLQNRQDE